GFSYLRSLLFPIKPEKSLEEFFINRFGRELYQTFFQSYTEKVWGIRCSELSAEWGAQRVKGLSIAKAVLHYVKSLFIKEKTLSQKNTQTSLIEQFIYPKYGPGQMWEEVTRRVRELGGEVWTEHEVDGIHVEYKRVRGVDTRD